MNKLNRRHFTADDGDGVNLPVALKASALPSPNDMVRVAIMNWIQWRRARRISPPI